MTTACPRAPLGEKNRGKKTTNRSPKKDQEGEAT